MGTVVMSISVHITNNLTRGVGAQIEKWTVHNGHTSSHGKKEEFPVIANNYYNINKSNSLYAGLTYRHPTYISKLKSIVVSPLVKA